MLSKGQGRISYLGRHKKPGAAFPNGSRAWFFPPPEVCRGPRSVPVPFPSWKDGRTRRRVRKTSGKAANPSQKRRDTSLLMLICRFPTRSRGKRDFPLWRNAQDVKNWDQRGRFCFKAAFFHADFSPCKRELAQAVWTKARPPRTGGLNGIFTVLPVFRLPFV